MFQSFFYAVRRWSGYISKLTPWHSQTVACCLDWTINLVCIETDSPAADWTITTAYWEAF